MLSYTQNYYQNNRDRLRESSNNYYHENREECKAKNKKWFLNENNKEKQREYMKKWLNNNNWQETHTCECGGRYTYHHQLRHNKSKKHQAYLEKQ